MKVLTRFSQIFDVILNILAAVGIASIGFVMLLVVAGVVSRYFFHQPIMWAWEVTEYELMSIPFLGGAWLLVRGGHIRIDILSTRFNPRIQTLFDAFISLLSTVVWLIITWYAARISWEYFEAGYKTITWVKIPKWPLFGIITLGSFFLFIQCLRDVFKYIRS